MIRWLHNLISGPTEHEGISSPEISHLLQDAKRMELQMRRKVSNDLLGEYSSAFFGQGLSFAELREYQPGDDPKKIHWNVTARFGKPYVKVFHEERLLHVIILLDVSPSMQLRGRHSDSVQFGSFLVSASRKARDKISLVTFSNRIHTLLPPGGSRSHFRRAILALQTPPELPESSSGTDLGSVLHEIREFIPNRSAVFILSDFESENFAPQLRELTLRHSVNCVYFPDTGEHLEKISGVLRVRTPESGLSAVIRPQRAIKQADSHWNTVRSTLEETGANVVKFNGSLGSTLRELSRCSRRKLR